MNIAKVLERTIEEESFSPYSFWDDAKGGGKGQFTWGYGTPAPGPNAYITKEKALSDLRKKLEQCVVDLEEIFHGYSIPSDKEDALLDMMYNLGETRFRQFKRMIAAVKVGDWKEAGRQVRNSIYYKQVTNRAEENAVILEAV